jgi:hypothetical protein
MELREKQNFRWSATFLSVVLTAFFLLNLPVTFVDRLQEHWYLGIPFERLKTGAFWVDRDDPFPENAPHLMYLLAKLTYATGSLLSVRLAQWPWSLLAMVALWAVLHKLTGFLRGSRFDVLGMSLLVLFFWISLPLGFVYPVQTNGMMAGFVCLALGLLVLRERPAAAMLLFGFAYAHKAQFIMFFPCVIAYRLVLDYPGRMLGRHLARTARDTVLLFVPAAVILPLFLAACGAFRSAHDFFGYATEGPLLLWRQVAAVLGKFTGAPPANPLANTFRLQTLTAELASYSKLVYMHIYLSAGLGIAGLAWTLRGRLPAWWGGKVRAEPPPELALLSVMTCVAWITYFRFNMYPYCYNMLPILPFNALVVPYVFWRLRGVVPGAWFARGGYALALIFLVVLGYRYGRNFAALPRGDALEPYYWMRQGKSWTSDR